MTDACKKAVSLHDAWDTWRKTYDGGIAHSIVGLDKHQYGTPNPDPQVDKEWLRTHMLQACWRAYEAGFKAGEVNGRVVAGEEIGRAVAKMIGEK